MWKRRENCGEIVPKARTKCEWRGREDGVCRNFLVKFVQKPQFIQMPIFEEKMAKKDQKVSLIYSKLR